MKCCAKQFSSSVYSTLGCITLLCHSQQSSKARYTKEQIWHDILALGYIQICLVKPWHNGQKGGDIFFSQKLRIISFIPKMNISLKYQNKKKKETSGNNNNLVQENMERKNRKQIGWLTLNDILMI